MKDCVKFETRKGTLYRHQPVPLICSLGRRILAEKQSKYENVLQRSGAGAARYNLRKGKVEISDQDDETGDLSKGERTERPENEGTVFPMGR